MPVIARRPRMFIAIRSMASLLGLCGLLCGAVLDSSALAAAEPATSAAPEPLPAAHARALKQYLQGVTSEQQDEWKSQMQDTASKIVEATHANAKAAASLNRAIDASVKAASAAWRKQLERHCNDLLADLPGYAVTDGLEELTSAWPQLTMPACAGPPEQAVWLDALKNSLTQEQLAIVKKMQATERAAADKAIDQIIQGRDGEFQSEIKLLLQQKTESIETALSLSVERGDELERLVEATQQQTLAAWRERIRLVLRNTATRDPHPSLKELPSLITFPELHPAEQPVWKDGLAKLLRADELEKVLQQERKAEAALDQQIHEEFLEFETQTRLEWTENTAADIAELAQANLLPQGGREKLEALAADCLEKSFAAWHPRLRRVRARMTESNQPDQQMDEDEIIPLTFRKPETLDTWQSGIKAVTGPAGYQLYQSLQTAADAKKTQARVNMLIAYLDEILLLTKAQREQLQPLAAKLFQKPGKNAEPQDEEAFSPENALEIAQRIPKHALAKFLDAIQMAQFAKLATIQDDEQNMSDFDSMLDSLTRETASELQKTKPKDDADRERQVSEISHKYFERLLDSQRKKNLAAVHDLKRVVELPDAVLQHLETAARGAAETDLAQLREGLEHSLDPDSKRENRHSTPERAPLADGNSESATRISEALTAQQRVVWEKHLAQRRDYLESALADLMLFHFNEIVRLRPQQWDKLRPLIKAQCADLDSDLSTLAGGANWMDWATDPSYLFVPFMAIPAREWKKLLPEYQLAKWRRSKAFESAKEGWQSIRQIRKDESPALP